VYDVEQIAAAAEVPDGPLDGVLGLLGAVDGDHEVALVLVVAGVGGVERGEGSFPQKMEGWAENVSVAPYSVHVSAWWTRARKKGEFISRINYNENMGSDVQNNNIPPLTFEYPACPRK